VGWLYLLTAVSVVIFGGPRLEGIVGLGYLAFLMFGSVSLVSYTRMWYFHPYILPVVPFLAICFGHEVRRMQRLLLRWFRSRGELGRQLRYLCPGCLLLFFTGVFIISALQAGRLSTLWTRTRMIWAVARDSDCPVYATRWFIHRYRGVLDESTLNVLKPLGGVEPLPSRYRVVVDNVDKKQAAISKVDWRHAVVRGQPMERTVFRRIVDVLRGRSVEFYERWYKPPFYVVTVDSTTPPVSQSDTTPWEDGGAGTPGKMDGRDRAHPSDKIEER
jgi:hypothetical protein